MNKFQVQVVLDLFGIVHKWFDRIPTLSISRYCTMAVSDHFTIPTS